MFEFWDVTFVDTCSACATDADCEELDICVAVFDIDEWAGSAQCLPPGTLAQDSHCDLEGNGDQACSSGICATVDVLGTDVIGACGECDDDSDCGGGVCGRATRHLFRAAHRFVLSVNPDLAHSRASALASELSTSIPRTARDDPVTQEN